MAERRFRVIAYDIADDRRRARLAKALERVGERVQDSIFEGWLDDRALDRFLRRAAALVTDPGDSMRVYTLCEGCRPETHTIGADTPSEVAHEIVV